MPTRATSQALGSFDQASYQSISELLPLPVVCSSLLGFVSYHSLKWRIAKSRPQRPEQCNIRRRDVSLLRISEKQSCRYFDYARVLTWTQPAPLSLESVIKSDPPRIRIVFIACGLRRLGPAKIPHCTRSSSDSRSTAKQDKVCDRDQAF
jgi:hypothetical protein